MSLLREEGEYGLVCGIDEAGRGPLAGPVCAAAVILPVEFDLSGLNDSKKLSEKKPFVNWAAEAYKKWKLSQPELCRWI